MSSWFATPIPLLLSFLFAGPTTSVVPIEQKLSSEGLKEDVAVLREALVAIHPGLYRYNTPQQIDANFSELSRALGSDPSLADAFVAFSQFTAKIKCGHTYPNMNNQRKSIRASLLARADKVPFYFRWIDGGRMVVTKNFSGERALDRGAEVLAINGTPVKEILHRLMSIARADGSNDAKRVNLLAVSGAERFETFDVYFPLLFPSTSSKLKLTVKPAGSKAEQVVSVNAITYEQRLSARPPEPDETQPLWTVTYPSDKLTLLKMETWVAYNTKWDWKKFIDDTFDELANKNVEVLVIDLRGNEGGSSVGDQILARLIDRPIPAANIERFTRYSKTPASLNQVLDTWDPTFKDWGREAIGPIDLADRATGLSPGCTSGFYRLREDDEGPGQRERMIAPKGPRFTGKVFVLVDVSNSSATFEFANVVKQLKLATLVGQPTGGNQRGINGGAFFFLRLPYSKIEIDLPIIAQFPKRSVGPLPDAGIEPDIRTSPTIEDIAAGTDVEMLAVKRSLESR